MGKGGDFPHPHWPRLQRRAFSGPDTDLQGRSFFFLSAYEAVEAWTEDKLPKASECDSSRDQRRLPIPCPVLQRTGVKLFLDFLTLSFSVIPFAALPVVTFPSFWKLMTVFLFSTDWLRIYPTHISKVSRSITDNPHAANPVTFDNTGHSMALNSGEDKSGRLRRKEGKDSHIHRASFPYPCICTQTFTYIISFHS